LAAKAWPFSKLEAWNRDIKRGPPKAFRIGVDKGAVAVDSESSTKLLNPLDATLTEKWGG